MDNNLPVFKSKPTANHQYLGTASKIAKKSATTTIKSESWAPRITELDKKIKKYRDRKNLNLNITKASFLATQNALELAAVTLPAPGSYALWATFKATSKLKSHTIVEMEKAIHDGAKRIAITAAKRIESEYANPYSSVVNGKSINQQAEIVSDAISNLDERFSDLDVETKYQLAKSAVKILNNLIERGDDISQSPQSDDISSDISSYENGVEATAKLIEGEKNLTQQGEKLAEKAQDIAKNVEMGQPIEQHKIFDLEAIANDVVAAAQIAPDVLNAFVSLGMSAETAADIQKGVNLLANAATLYISWGSNPLGAIGAASNIISSVFGGSGDSAAQARHEQIMKHLGFIIEQNQKIMENQARIYEGLETISLNQGQILLSLNRVNGAVSFVYALQISIIQGPLYVLERDVKKRTNFFAPIYGYSEGPSYADVKDVFTSIGDNIYRGLVQLEQIFSDIDSLHPVLQANTFFGNTDFKLENADGISKFKLIDDNLQSNNAKRLSSTIKILENNGISERLLTELCTIDCLFGQYDHPTVTYDPLKSVVPFSFNDLKKSGLINIRSLAQLAVLAIKTQHLFPYFDFSGGHYQIKTREEILNTKPTTRGYQLLEVIHKQLCMAIAQHIILSSEFRPAMYLVGLYKGTTYLDGEEPIDTHYLKHDPQLVLNSLEFMIPEFNIPMFQKEFSKKAKQDYLHSQDTITETAGFDAVWGMESDNYITKIEEFLEQSNLSRAIYIQDYNYGYLKEDEWNQIDEYGESLIVENPNQPHIIFYIEGIGQISTLEYRRDASLRNNWIDITRKNRIDFDGVSEYIKRTILLNDTIIENDNEFKLLISLRDSVSKLLVPYSAYLDNDTDFLKEFTKLTYELS